VSAEPAQRPSLLQFNVQGFAERSQALSFSALADEKFFGTNPRFDHLRLKLPCVLNGIGLFHRCDLVLAGPHVASSYGDCSRSGWQ
jgi:hypothetical protein